MILAQFVTICLTILPLAYTIPNVNYATSAPPAPPIIPGAFLQLSQSGLNYAGNVAIDILAKNIQQMNIENFTGKQKVLLNNVQYTISNIKIGSFIPPSSTVVVNAGSGLSWSLTNAAISFTGNWAYNYKLIFIKIRDSGTFDVTVTGVSATASATLGIDQKGSPTIRMLRCSCTVVKANVKFHGGASWLYNLFSGAVEGPLKDAIQREVCKAAEKTINTNAAAELATLETRVTIADTFVLDYSLTRSPEFKSGYIQISDRGEVFYATDRSHAPFVPPQISVTPPTRMAAAYLTEYVANTLGYVIFRNNFFAYNITKDDIPDYRRVRLLTSCDTDTICFGSLYPRARELYPNSSLEFQLSASEAPNLTITSSEITGTIRGKARVVARTPSGTTGDIASLGATITVKLYPNLEGNKLVATVQEVTPQANIESSEIGSVNQEDFDELIGMVSNDYIHIKLNEVGSTGIEIPNVEKVDFISPSISLIQGALMVSTDVRYNL